MHLRLVYTYGCGVTHPQLLFTLHWNVCWYVGDVTLLMHIHSYPRDVALLQLAFTFE